MEQTKERKSYGRCPVCGGDIIKTSTGYACNGVLPEGGKCGFTVHGTLHGVQLTDELARELFETGRIDILPMVNKLGQKFRGRLILDGDHVGVELEKHILKGRCPICGGRIIRTSKGYACENYLSKQHTCDFHALGILGNRKITEQEMEDFLAGNPEILDGFSSSQGKVFCGTLTLNKDKMLAVTSRVSRCPVCGGHMLVGLKSFNCENFNNTEHPCKTTFWRHLQAHDITKKEIDEICKDGSTHEPVELTRANGQIYHARLALNSSKTEIIKLGES